MKKLLSVLLATVMLFSVFTVTPVTASGEALPVATAEKAEISFFDDIIAFFSDIIAFITDLFDFQTELPDVSEWTDEEIIEYYKKTASKSAWMLIGDRTLDTNWFGDDSNVDGEFSKVFNDYFQAATPTKMRGVMGDYRKLTVDDCKSAKAYIDKEYLVIEIIFKDEIDSMHDEKDVVTASHGMKLLEDSDEQWKAIRMMGLYGTKIDLSEGDYLMKYSDAKAVVKMNKNGFVEEGEWTFKASMTFQNVKMTIMPQNVSFVMDGAVSHYDSTIVVK